MDYIEDRKYWKILEGQNLNTIDKNILNLLIEKEIISEYQNPFKIEWASSETGKVENSISFERFITFESKAYELNPAIGIEMYHSLKYCIENIEGDDEWEKAEIEIELEGIIQKDEKLKYLEKKHSDLYSQFKTLPEFLIYIGKREFNGFETWEELVIEDVLSEEEDIINYLVNGKIPTGEIYTDWLDYYRAADLIEYCKNNYNILAGLTDTGKINIKGLDTSKQVLLLEAIRNITNWEELSATKKGKIISRLIDKNADNIKDIYLNMDKKQSDNTQKFLSDKKLIDKLINELLG